MLLDKQLRGDMTATNDIDLHWSTIKSYANSTTHFTSHYSQRPSTSSLPPDTCFMASPPPVSSSPPSSTPTSPGAYYAVTEGGRRLTPPPTPKSAVKGGKFPTTPPPHKRNKLYPEAFPLIKSKSHESQLSSKISQDSDVSR